MPYLPTYLPTYLPGEGDVFVPATPSWNGVVYQDNYVGDALGRLIIQYKGKPRMEGMLSALVSPIQDLENAIWEVLTETNVSSAQAGQLDVLGRIVGEARRGRDDATYARWIRARIRANRSAGRPEDFFAILDALFPGSTTQILDFHPNVIDIVTDFGLSPVGLAQDVNRILQSARAAAHRIDFLYSTSSAGNLIWNSVTISETWNLGYWGGSATQVP